MAADLPAPGVYVKEIPSGLRIITGAGTSTPAFLGYPVVRPETGSTPQPVRSWNEFVDAFHFRSGLTPKEVDEALAPLKQPQTDFKDADDTLKGQAVPEHISAEDYARFGTLKEALGAGRELPEEDKKFVDDTVLKVKDLAGHANWEAKGKPWWPVAARWRELTGLKEKLTAGQKYALAEAVYGFFANGGTKCYVVPLDPGNNNLKAEVDSGLTGLLTVPDVHMVAVPDLWTNNQAAAAARPVIDSVVQHCTRMRNRLAIAEPPPGSTKPTEAIAFAEELASHTTDDAAFTTLYYPWVTVPGLQGVSRTVPPCGHIAGVWARTDAERGVFKAPANQNLRGVLSVPTILTDGQNGELNEKGVNCLRVFPDRGLLVWGARTRSSSRDWKYVNVRRLVSFLSDSIRQSSTWAVFEPNDERLWATLRHSVSSFLTDQWRQGALVGHKPDEAFYVICDDTNNRRESIDEGKVVCDIGVAPVRPAEFVHFTITQIAGQPGKTS
ncbi:phage tail sheath family protein [Streptomyces sp. AV19]|uniref:phage tail sheath family protein n=1 Tax=Streptomyces sp. AV19 TaxID=2793068 RepID=UPI0018FEF0C0|nr:phage tail sheath subtilisin-like domain-containing protein [Streptomyces sp. AV19]MBH1934418.1 phage tail sheath family protein [Streptomyces sp. AV19]MDG4536272.1 phage tail sheath subtilisin-like domain-containing protein [Streptomyces sp. AV19]